MKRLDCNRIGSVSEGVEIVGNVVGSVEGVMVRITT